MASIEDGVFTNALQNTKAVAETDETEEGEEHGADGEQDGEKPESEVETAKETEENGQQKESEEQKEETERIGNPEELTEDEREEIAEKVAEALEENAEALENGTPPDDATSEAKDQEKSEKVESAETEEMKDEENGTDEKKADTETSKDASEVSSTDQTSAEDEKDKVNGEESATKQSSEKMDVETESEKTQEEAGDKTLEGEECEQDQDGDSATQEDELENLQLAWEALEVARTICDKQIEQNQEGWQEKRADVLLALAECLIQNARYKQAASDIDVCIEAFRAVCKPSDRRIAEAYFQKARALALDKQFENAAETYKTVKKLLEEVLAYNQKEVESATNEEVKAEAQKQVDSLTALIPDIQVKIDDAYESAKNAEQVDQEKAAEDTAKLATVKTDSSKEVDDISGLVRKKPVKRAAPIEETTEANGTEELKKKARCVLEEATKQHKEEQHQEQEVE
ncbi:unnamed protein product [Anisakis simplex]|uniref:Nuclear autoantigenic sperm protein (inferred by orthology to a human protein) n=1 Tax=Anisakis simplex TaxID=6269 RepID=A0A0M3K4R7_ANISI|nr:unnamed protein product [Anisakis simplex]